MALSRFALLTLPTTLMLLASAWILFKNHNSTKGVVEMLIGTILMSTNIAGGIVFYYFSINHPYVAESTQESYLEFLDVLQSLFPIGLAVFSVGFARMSNLLAHVRGKQNV